MDCLYGENDILVGEILSIWGQKFSRLKKQNFIKIYGSAGCEIKKPLWDNKLINNLKQDEPNLNFHNHPSKGFDKRPNLIAEPECKSNCPDAKGKGVKKHYHKRGGHTPAKKYDVLATELCAFCYIDKTRQTRRLYITPKKIMKRGAIFERCNN